VSRDQILDVALAYDSDPIRVRRQVAAWLVAQGDSYAAGCAASLLRREPRQHVWREQRSAA